MLTRVLNGKGGLRTHKSLTKNSNVKILQFFSYLWVDLETIREVNWNDVNFTTILLLCWEIGEGLYLCSWVKWVERWNTLPINSLISSATFCSLLTSSGTLAKNSGYSGANPTLFTAKYEH